MEVRIKILYTSICHTDLSAWKGENESQSVYPRILGHEAVGVIESIGEGVEDMREGDYVVPVFNGECGHCIYCKSDHKTNLCERYRVNPLKSVMLADSKTRFWTQNGRPIYHFLNTSTFTEFTVLDSACVVKIDSDSPLKKVSLLSCGVSTGLGAAWNTANVQPGSTVAIFGLGAVGLAVAEGARTRGASRIIGVDINPDKFIKGKLFIFLTDAYLYEIIGKAMGITDFINPNDVDSVSEGWGLTVILGIHTTPEMMPFHPMELFQGRRIIGSVFGDFKPKTQLPLLARQCVQGMMRGKGGNYNQYNKGDTTCTKIFVGGLAWETKREHMEHYFERFGAIEEAVVITDKTTGRSKGYGFVTFKDPNAAMRACECPCPVIDGRRTNCNLASLGAQRRATPQNDHKRSFTPPMPTQPMSYEGPSNMAYFHQLAYYAFPSYECGSGFPMIYPTGGQQFLNYYAVAATSTFVPRMSWNSQTHSAQFAQGGGQQQGFEAYKHPSMVQFSYNPQLCRPPLLLPPPLSGAMGDQVNVSSVTTPTQGDDPIEE
ncbi:hypothetical protein Sjap_005714 [Stephania japonica]|uniref:RRM domain-containing protein n=1 Tax=Stephania japonica TaxID=461633 RepID=A0AAP0PM57_9MAGN